MRCASNAAQSQLRQVLAEQLSGIKEAGTFKAERIITSSQSTQITVQGSDKRILNFCANNYLGLAVSAIFLATNLAAPSSFYSSFIGRTILRLSSTVSSCWNSMALA